MVRNIATLAQKAGGDLEKLLGLTYPGKSLTVADFVKEMVATIGENMSVRRCTAMSAVEGTVSEYMHNRVADGLGKIGVLVALESKGERGAVANLGRQLCLHIAAANPAAISAEDLAPELVERERAVYTEQAKASGKSPEIAAKMVEGRLRKEFFQQVVLLQQVFLGAGGDGKSTVEQVLKAAEKAAGAPIRIAKFARYALGEGIDKKDGDFAAEVAKAAGKR
jgi:elongation factor Ts